MKKLGTIALVMGCAIFTASADIMAADEPFTGEEVFLIGSFNDWQLPEVNDFHGAFLLSRGTPEDGAIGNGWNDGYINLEKAEVIKFLFYSPTGITRKSPLLVSKRESYFTRTTMNTPDNQVQFRYDASTNYNNTDKVENVTPFTIWEWDGGEVYIALLDIIGMYAHSTNQSTSDENSVNNLPEEYPSAAFSDEEYLYNLNGIKIGNDADIPRGSYYIRVRGNKAEKLINGN